MADYIYSLILLIIALVSIELRKSYYEIPKAELRHRARQGDALAEKLYKARSYEESLDILLWLVVILCAAGSLLLFNRVAPLWLDFIAVVVFVWLAFAWLPRIAPNIVSRKLAVYLTPVIVWILNYVHPLFKRVYKLSGNKGRQHHTGLYSKKDLNELIDKQSSQSDNRIRVEDLELIKKVFKLSDKTVSEYCQSWSKIKHAKATEPIGPVLLDELHKSGQTYVPIVDSADNKKVVGIVNLSLVDIARSGELRDQMDRNVYYLKESDSLEDALTAMTNSGRPVFMVLDKKDRVFGMITLKDVLSEFFSFSNDDRDYRLADSDQDQSAEAETSDQPKLSES